MSNEICRGCLDSLWACKKHDKYVVNYVVVLLSVIFVVQKKDAYHVDGFFLIDAFLLPFGDEAFYEVPQCFAIDKEAPVRFSDLFPEKWCMQKNQRVFGHSVEDVPEDYIHEIG